MSPADILKCSLCGYEFKEGDSASACSGCAIMKGCKLIRCPNCGYEWPPEPKWLKNLQKRRNK